MLFFSKIYGDPRDLHVPTHSVPPRLSSDLSASSRRASATALKPLLTHVELTWHEKKIEHWIRFGHPAHEQILDRRRRIVSFAPDAIFAFVRWASNDFGTIISRIDIVRAIRTGEPHQTDRTSVV